MLRCIVALPNADNSLGTAKMIFTDSEAAVEDFLRKHDNIGWGIFECLGKFPPGTTKRNKETVGSLERLAVDIDFKNIEQSPEDILTVLTGLCLPPSEIHSSGHGYRLLFHLKEPLTGDDMARGERAMARFAELLGADPAPTNRASLFRLPGSSNTKDGDKKPCHVLPEYSDPSQQYDITELEEMFNLYERPLLTRKAAAATNGGDAPEQQRGPTDVDARLAAMEWHGSGNSCVNVTVRDCMASLLRQGHLPRRGIRDPLRCSSAVCDGQARRREGRLGKGTPRDRSLRHSTHQQGS
jgi:hypothetical protein